MKKEVFRNGMRLLYKFKEGGCTSFSVALQAGANKENNNIGVAHALEHMIFKGTKSLSEEYINNKIDELFGISNAMTNFPYVIYYGATANEDFEEALRLYGDMLVNPSLNSKGFNEEINVIKQESTEWKEDLEQHCEDLLLFNGFKNERIHKIIIGEVSNVERITLEEISRFYEKFYVANNMVISVVSSLNYEEVEKIVYNVFKNLKTNKEITNKNINRIIKSKTYVNEIEGFAGCKITTAFDISHLALKEITALKLFNLWFGDGVSSILYDEIRTKAGLAYEVYSEVKGEKGISLFKINVSTSKENIDKVIRLIEQCIYKGKLIEKYLTEFEFSKIKKRFKLKTSMDLERSIVLANRVAIYEIMYNNGEHIFNELNLEYDYTIDDISNIVNSIFKNPITQILK